MIVSHRHRFIFMHCRKVAGSSLKVSLAPSLGPDDVLIGSWNEVLSAGTPLNPQAQSILRSPKARLFYWAARAKGKSQKEAVNIGIKGHYKSRLSANPPHPTAEEAKRFFPEEWQRYYKFSFVRNPYERLASDYYWRRRMTGKALSFKDYLRLLEQGNDRKSAIHPGGASNWEMISIGGNLEMDFVGQYEKLNEDFERVCKHLGIPDGEVSSSEKVKSGGRNYGSLYGPEEREIVRRMCSPEIEMFNYEFPY